MYFFFRNFLSTICWKLFLNNSKYEFFYFSPSNSQKTYIIFMNEKQQFKVNEKGTIYHFFCSKRRVEWKKKNCCQYKVVNSMNLWWISQEILCEQIKWIIVDGKNVKVIRYHRMAIIFFKFSIQLVLYFWL